MKLMILCYLPPPSAEHSPFVNALLANLKVNVPATELVFFSPHQWTDRTLPLTSGPELVSTLGHQGQENMKFFTACRIAMGGNATHFLYIDTSCRFSHPNGTTTWDKAIWDEFFNRRPYAAVGGSMVINNMARAELVWMHMAEATSGGPRGALPVQHIGTNLPSAVYANGPLSIFSTHWLREIFGDMGHTINLCHQIHPFPFDAWFGAGLQGKLGLDAFKSVLHMTTIVSTVEPIMGNAERLALIAGDESACAINGVTPY